MRRSETLLGAAYDLSLPATNATHSISDDRERRLKETLSLAISNIRVEHTCSTLRSTA
jgi:hypothetical protein